jgi:hypothetical protein
MKPRSRYRPSVEGLESLNLMSVVVPSVDVAPVKKEPKPRQDYTSPIDGHADGTYTRLAVPKSYEFHALGELSIGDKKSKANMDGEIFENESHTVVKLPSYVSIYARLGTIKLTFFTFTEFRFNGTWNGKEVWGHGNFKATLTDAGRIALTLKQ